MEAAQIRARYAAAAQDARQAAALYADLTTAKLSPLVGAYRGATSALLARYDANPFQKLQLLQRATREFAEAVRAEADNPEIRLLRFAVQQATPRFLGLSGDLRADQRVIVAGADRLPAEAYPALYTELLGFVLNSGLCTPADRTELQQRLALLPS